MSNGRKKQAPKGFAIAFFLYLSFIVYGTLIPFDRVLDPALIRNRREQVELSFFYHFGKRASLPDFVSNLLLFIPMGFLIYANLCHSRARAVPKILVCLVLGFLP